VLYSRSKEIIVRPLKVERSPEMLLAMDSFVQDVTANGAQTSSILTRAFGLQQHLQGQKNGADIDRSAVANVLENSPSPAAELVACAYQRMGMLSPSSQQVAAIPKVRNISCVLVLLSLTKRNVTSLAFFGQSFAPAAPEPTACFEGTQAC
jgi:hypothetical protein